MFLKINIFVLLLILVIIGPLIRYVVSFPLTKDKNSRYYIYDIKSLKKIQRRLTFVKNQCENLVKLSKIFILVLIWVNWLEYCFKEGLIIWNDKIN